MKRLVPADEWIRVEFAPAMRPAGHKPPAIPGLCESHRPRKLEPLPQQVVDSSVFIEDLDTTPGTGGSRFNPGAP
ncbi:MAG TPA: hypothetical protein VK742_05535 [Candidatus Sulfotelmatobacter sp.]|nr:hypothetical protein [Candidatus Sulfotelmatobacter sp.]